MKRLLLLVMMACTVTVAAGSAVISAEESVGGGEIIYSEPVKAVIFSHKAHVTDLGMSCEMCHDGIFQYATGSALAAGDFTMQSLYDGKYCGACHNGSWAFASDTQCARCHIGVKGYKALTGEQEDEGHH
jgi:c(7)-type cytochrome triheme protein